MLFTKAITLFTVSLALFMDVLDTNIINTAIPAMAKSLQVNPIDLKVTLISYFLSLAMFIPISGWVADKYNVKKVFIFAIALFSFSSWWCGYAHTLIELVIMRGLQGIGGAFMISLGRLIIAHLFQRHELIEAMNTVIIVVSIAVMVGPFIGGFITDHLSWSWVFWINVPAGILTMILGWYGLENIKPKKKSRSFDSIGFLLFGGSLALLCFALSKMSESIVDIYSNMSMIIISIIMFITYILHAKKHIHPIINIKLLSIRTFRISILGNLFSRLGFGAIPFLLPLLQQLILGFSAELSGLLLLPMAFGIIIAKLVASKILRKIGYKTYLLINTPILGGTLFAFQLIHLQSSVYLIAILAFIFGLLVASQYTAINSLAFADIEEDVLNDSVSITSSTQVIAQSLGVALGAILLRYYMLGSQYPHLLTMTVFHNTFFTMGIITLLSSILFIYLKANDGNRLLHQRI